MTFRSVLKDSNHLTNTCTKTYKGSPHFSLNFGFNLELFSTSRFLKKEDLVLLLPIYYLWTYINRFVFDDTMKTRNFSF